MTTQLKRYCCVQVAWSVGSLRSNGCLRCCSWSFGRFRGGILLLVAMWVRLHWFHVRMLFYWFAVRIDITWIICAVKICYGAWRLSCSVFCSYGYIFCIFREFLARKTCCGWMIVSWICLVSWRSCSTFELASVGLTFCDSLDCHKDVSCRTFGEARHLFVCAVL